MSSLVRFYMVNIHTCHLLTLEEIHELCQPEYFTGQLLVASLVKDDENSRQMTDEERSSLPQCIYTVRVVEIKTKHDLILFRYDTSPLLYGLDCLGWTGAYYGNLTYNQGHGYHPLYVPAHQLFDLMP